MTCYPVLLRKKEKLDVQDVACVKLSQNNEAVCFLFFYILNKYIALHCNLFLHKNVSMKNTHNYRKTLYISIVNYIILTMYIGNNTDLALQSKILNHNHQTCTMFI